MKIPFVKKDKKVIEKPKRTTQEVQKEYAELCAIAGDKNYRKDVLDAEVKQINQRLFQLNQEGAELSKEAKPEGTEQSL